MSFLSEVFKDLGGLDENYSGTGFRWETDLCVRVRKAGRKIIFNPEAKVFHDTDFKKFMTPHYKYYEGRNDISPMKGSFPYNIFLLSINASLRRLSSYSNSSPGRTPATSEFCNLLILISK